MFSRTGGVAALLSRACVLAALWGVCLVLCGFKVVNAQLASEINHEASKVLGKANRHGRAITCSKGGWFKSLEQSYTEGSGFVHTLTICCDDGFSIWWEGMVDPPSEPCVTIGKGEEENSSALPWLHAAA
jgi:hypothetical protein